MKKRLKVLLAFGALIIAAAFLSLRFGLERAARVSESKEADVVRGIVSRKVSTGEKKEELLRFFQDQGWSPTFDRFQGAYVAEAFKEEKHGLTIHNVTVHVFMSGDSVSRFEIREAFKGL